MHCGLRSSRRWSTTAPADDYEKKARAFIEYILPNLDRKFSPQKAAEYVISLMPARLAADSRRIKADCKRDGTLLDLMHVLRECKSVVFKDQKPGTAPKPALSEHG